MSSTIVLSVDSLRSMFYEVEFEQWRYWDEEVRKHYFDLKVADKFNPEIHVLEMWVDCPNDVYSSEASGWVECGEDVLSHNNLYRLIFCPERAYLFLSGRLTEAIECAKTPMGKESVQLSIGVAEAILETLGEK